MVHPSGLWHFKSVHQSLGAMHQMNPMHDLNDISFYPFQAEIFFPF